MRQWGNEDPLPHSIASFTHCRIASLPIGRLHYDDKDFPRRVRAIRMI
jgi:hypothetical protein